MINKNMFTDTIEINHWHKLFKINSNLFVYTLILSGKLDSSLFVYTLVWLKLKVGWCRFHLNYRL